MHNCQHVPNRGQGVRSSGHGGLGIGLALAGVETGVSDLTMYTTPWCGYCRRLKSQLQRAGIDFAEVDIERDPTSADRVAEINSGDQTVPTLVFADGSALTNPSVAQVSQRLAALG